MGRLATAWKAFWAILGSDEAARRWRQLATDGQTEVGVAAVEPAPVATVPSATPMRHADAVYTLVLLQRAGRLIDFLREDIAGYSDQQVGAAVRQIHAGCGKVLDESFDLQPIRPESEGQAVRVEAGFDATAIRLTGNVVGEPPFTGVLRHPGWQVGKVDFPARGAAVNPAVVCPAEVEV